MRLSWVTSIQRLLLYGHPLGATSRRTDATREDYIDGCSLTEREFLLVKLELRPGALSVASVSSAYAQWAVVDVGAIAQLVQQLQTMQQQLETARNQLEEQRTYG